MRLTLIVLVVIVACTQSQKKGLESMSTEEINKILGSFSENEAIFTEKDISFDSIVTYAGRRSQGDKSVRIKLKMFFFGDKCRGYYNLADTDNKNLQIFGKNVGGNWALKSVTKLNMEEVGGYMLMIIKDNVCEGIWSNGEVNFKKGSMHLVKQNTDYNLITDW